MRPLLPGILLIIALAACSDRDTAPSASVLQALDVWERGAAAIPEPATDDPLEPPPPPPPELERFVGFDQVVREFLDYPDVEDAVQFGCVRRSRPTEEALTAALTADDLLDQLRALVVLVRVRAPRTVELQWQTLQGLRQGPRAAEFTIVTDRLMTAFSPAAIDAVLATTPTASRNYQWNLRAASVTRHRAALPRLAVASRAKSIELSLAALHSLLDFEGDDVNAALATCLQGWQYPAYLGAGRALLTRDPELLRATLLASQPPEKMLYDKGILLAALDDPRAVPILCATVPDIAIVDKEMFDDIERLALPEHRAAVEALPDRVRPEQQQRAADLVRRVRARLDQLTPARWATHR